MVAGTVRKLQEDHRFAELIRKTCGIVFDPGAAEERLFNVISGRMAAFGIAAPDDYFDLVRREAHELQALIELLTVNETYFFREPEYLNLLIGTLIPEYLARRGSGPVRILSAGCSTGEEVYSLAILLNERFGGEAERFEVTGIDIDSKALAVAERGTYATPSFRRTDPSLRDAYFECCGIGNYRVRDEIRRQVRFERVNLLGEGTELLMQQDFITYRNVSIYFASDVQCAIFRRLADLLPEGGALIVGASETLHHDIGVLPLVERNQLFYFSKERAQQRGMPGQLRAQAPTECAIRSARLRQPAPQKAGKEAGRERHAPPFGEPVARKVAAASPRLTAGSGEDTFSAALAAARQMQYNEALALVEAAIVADPSPTQLVLKAGILLQTGHYDEAEPPAESALDLDPLCAQASLILGIAARNRGDDQAAFRRFREALYGDASCWLAHFYAAEMMFARNEASRARAGYETVINLLEKGDDTESRIFPLAFEPSQFLSICRHKLALLGPK